LFKRFNTLAARTVNLESGIFWRLRAGHHPGFSFFSKGRPDEFFPAVPGSRAIDARYVVLRFRRMAISPGLLVPVLNKNMRLAA
jgi:hypothetical protein